MHIELAVSQLEETTTLIHIKIRRCLCGDVTESVAVLGVFAFSENKAMVTVWNNYFPKHFFGDIDYSSQWQIQEFLQKGRQPCRVGYPDGYCIT